MTSRAGSAPNWCCSGARSAAASALPGRSVCAHGQAQPPRPQQSDGRLRTSNRRNHRPANLPGQSTSRRRQPGATGRGSPAGCWRPSGDCHSRAPRRRCRDARASVRRRTWRPGRGDGDGHGPRGPGEPRTGTGKGRPRRWRAPLTTRGVPATAAPASARHLRRLGGDGRGPACGRCCRRHLARATPRSPGTRP